MTALNESIFLPLILVTVAACINALTTVSTEYLESVGATWSQCWFVEFFVCAVLTVWYWIISFSLNYYHKRTSNKENCDENDVPNHNYHQIQTSPSDDDDYGYDHDHHHQENGSYLKINNNNYNSISTVDSSPFNFKNITFWSFLLTVFPPLDEKHKTHWLVLISRSVIGMLCFASLNLALMYLDSGDTILIQMVLVTLFDILFGVIFFNEKLNKIIISAVIICIIGLILVTQPSFIFGGSDVNAIGIAIIFFCAFTRALVAVLVKYTKNIQLSVATTIVAPLLLMSLMVTIIFLVGICIPSIGWDVNIFIIHNGSDDDDDNDDENNSNYNVSDYLHLFCLLSLGLLFFLWVSSTAVGYRMGDLGRLALVENLEIVVAYLLDTVLLNEIENDLCYIGVLITMFGCALVFYEKHAESQNIDIDNINSNHIDDR